MVIVKLKSSEKYKRVKKIAVNEYFENYWKGHKINEAHRAASISTDNFLSFPSKLRFLEKYLFLGQ